MRTWNRQSAEAISIDRHVGRQIKLCRQRRGLSQRQLATELGITREAISQHERGVTSLSAAQLYWIAQILNVAVDYFYQGL